MTRRCWFFISKKNDYRNSGFMPPFIAEDFGLIKNFLRLIKKNQKKKGIIVIFVREKIEGKSHFPMSRTQSYS